MVAFNFSIWIATQPTKLDAGRQRPIAKIAPVPELRPLSFEWTTTDGF
jgi:hypothetical protein